MAVAILQFLFKFLLQEFKTIALVIESRRLYSTLRRSNYVVLNFNLLLLKRTLLKLQNEVFIVHHLLRKQSTTSIKQTL